MQMTGRPLSVFSSMIQAVRGVFSVHHAAKEINPVEVAHYLNLKTYRRHVYF